MTNVIISGFAFQYRSDKGAGIIVYDEKGNELGTWDDLNDLRYDVDNHPEWFKPDKKEKQI